MMVVVASCVIVVVLPLTIVVADVDVPYVICWPKTNPSVAWMQSSAPTALLHKLGEFGAHINGY